jgi:hypothetical protein
VSATNSSVDNSFSVKAALLTASEKAASVPPPQAGAGRQAAPVSSKRPDLAPIEEVLRLLARATRQFHTYPAASPMCIDAVMACHEALKAVPHRDRISARVTPRELIVDEASIGSGTVIEHELTRRLFRLRIATLDIDRETTPRHLTRFCIDLVGADDTEHSEMTFAERLAEHGVDSIVAEMAHRPAVLEVGAPAAPTRDLIDRERRRRDELTQPDAPISYLYPPDKGWIRIDPSQPLETVSLVDLMVLVNDPADVASMLLRLTGDEIGAGEHALERKYSDITMLCSALDPRLARVMFGKLAKAVLKLEPERRNNLLQRTILPGLLDGHADGQVLRDFPDVDLAESICLLLDLETAAPEVLSAALNRLDLAPDRRAAIEPLIEQRQRARQAGEPRTADSAGAATIEKHARALIRIDGSRSNNSFSEFAAFDLSIDDHATAMVTEVRDGITSTDAITSQLRCITHLVQIEPNSGLVEAFLKRAVDLVGMLERAERWADVVATIDGLRTLGTGLVERRPDVADTIARALADFCTPTRLLALAELHERDAAGRAIVHDMARALGAALVPGFIAVADHAAHQGKARALTTLMCDLAPTVAPSLVADLETRSVAAARVIAKVLGHAGNGYETPLARLVDHQDQQVSREALRSLARIGTAAAAAPIVRQIRKGGDTHAAAEDALWSFPPHQTLALLRDLLGSRDFVLHHPLTAGRLIERSGQGRVQGLDEVLKPFESFRYRFWKPSLVQLARKAKEYRER